MISLLKVFEIYFNEKEKQRIKCIKKEAKKKLKQ